MYKNRIRKPGVLGREAEDVEEGVEDVAEKEVGDVGERRTKTERAELTGRIDLGRLL